MELRMPREVRGDDQLDRELPGTEDRERRERVGGEAEERARWRHRRWGRSARRNEAGGPLNIEPLDS